MTNQDIFPYIDHTLLSPVATWKDIQTLCQESVTYQTASVCIPPSYVERVKKSFPQLTICTVIGFPLGYTTTSGKVKEAEQALKDGAKELDMVINLGAVKNQDFDFVASEIQKIRQLLPPAPLQSFILKVIIETCFLTQAEKIKLCQIISHSGADFIKTSTGFGTAGATVEDIELFQQYKSSPLKIKAAGGVKTKSDLETFIQLGCDRIGTSSAVKILTSPLKKSSDSSVPIY